MSEHIEKAGPAGRAIITFSRGWQTLVATRSLGRCGVQVVTGDEYRMTAASFSRYSIARNSATPTPRKSPKHSSIRWKRWSGNTSVRMRRRRTF